MVGGCHLLSLTNLDEARRMDFKLQLPFWFCGSSCLPKGCQRDRWRTIRSTSGRMRPIRRLWGRIAEIFGSWSKFVNFEAFFIISLVFQRGESEWFKFVSFNNIRFFVMS